MAEETLTWVKKSYTMDTGGGILVDVIVLKDGTTISITDDVVIVWEEEKHFIEYEVDQDGPLRNYTAICIDVQPHPYHARRNS